MPNLTHRADLTQVPELMDGPCSYQQLRACLHDLSRVNRLTRAYRPTLDFLSRATQQRETTAPLRIVDVGCGYGDTLRAIERWAASRNLPVALLGIDLNPNAIRAAREATPASSRIQFLAADATQEPAAQRADLIVCALVTHHIPEPGIVDLLRWMDATASRGWFICDLHRMPVPYGLFSALMRGPWWHPFIRPDGLASIRRSFRHADWRRIAASAGLASKIQLRTYTPARLCIEALKRAPTEPEI